MNQLQEQEDWRIRLFKSDIGSVLNAVLTPAESAMLDNFITTEIKRAKAEEREREKKMRLKILHKVETVFFLYLATFPAPRDALQKEIQDTIKDVVNTLKENVVGIINIS